MIKENFIKLYEDSFINNWELPVLTDYPTGKTITYGQLAEKIAETHLLFEMLGLKEGSKVALCGKDSISWAIVYMATITYGWCDCAYISRLQSGRYNSHRKP